MIRGYIRRQQFLARLQAVEVAKVFGGTSKGSAVAGQQHQVGASGKRYTQVSPDALLLRAGHGLVS